MIAIDAVKRTIVLVKKFGPYLCVPVFLMIAYSYTSSAYSKYRVTTKIALRDANIETAPGDIRSKYLVRRALDQLPFQASYYDINSPREEVFGSALPVRMVFDHPRSSDGEVWLNLDVTGKNSFTLTHGDTLAYHQFNEPVHEWYGNFKVVHKPGTAYSKASYMVRLDDPAKLNDQYYNNLRVETIGDDGVIVSIISGNAQKGIDFLNRLVQLYGSSKHSKFHHASARIAGVNAPGAVTILEKPENNVESVGIGSFWVYLMALLVGLAIPVGWSLWNDRRTNALSAKLLSISKMIRLSPRPAAARQLGVKVARYRRLLFREV